MKFLTVQEYAANPAIRDSAATAKSMEDVAKMDREALWVLHLDTRLQVIEREMVSLGTVNASISHPREVFKRAIVHGAVAIILVHNHPSGDPTPSVDDVNMTKQMVKAVKLLQIDVLDHLIITGNGKYFSFADKQMIG